MNRDIPLPPPILIWSFTHHDGITESLVVCFAEESEAPKQPLLTVSAYETDGKAKSSHRTVPRMSKMELAREQLRNDRETIMPSMAQNSSTFESVIFSDMRSYL